MLRSLLSLASVLAVTAGAGAASIPARSPAPGPTPFRLSFVSHAAFFSLQSRQAALVDPEVFVSEPGASAALGFEQIEHLAGVRHADMDDDPTAPALDANGQKLGFDLQHWFAANGVVQIEPFDRDHSTQRIVVRFANLVPNGRYSLFSLALDGHPPSYAPLDGNGKTNSFSAAADGTGGASVISQLALSHSYAIVLVYHADRVEHGAKAGSIGIDAFHQLIVRLP